MLCSAAVSHSLEYKVMTGYIITRLDANKSPTYLTTSAIENNCVMRSTWSDDRSRACCWEDKGDAVISLNALIQQSKRDASAYTLRADTHDEVANV